MSTQIEVFTPTQATTYNIPTDFEVTEVQIIVSVKTQSDGFTQLSQGYATADYSIVDSIFQDTTGGLTYRNAKPQSNSAREIVAVHDRVNGVKTKVNTARVNSITSNNVEIEVVNCSQIYQYELIFRG